MTEPNLPPEGGHGFSDSDFANTHGEEIEKVLDLGTWAAGVDLEDLHRRLDTEVGAAMEQERRVQSVVRAKIFPELAKAPDAPATAGKHTAKLSDVEAVHRKILFSGKLEACDGTAVTHDSLLLTVTQIGICLISYHGTDLTLSQRLFRRDLRATVADPVEEAMRLLEQRKTRAATDVEDRREVMSELARRGIMTYAERAALLRRSSARWRMGHGNIAPYELLTGSGNMKLLEAALATLEELIDYGRWVFVPSSIKDRLMLTVGDALLPMEYAVVATARRPMERIVSTGHYEGTFKDLAKDFVARCGHKVVMGVYRAARHAPAVPFFAHADHVHEAAHIAIADSVLQEHRGFPLAIDLADAACRAVFGPDTFMDAVASAYVDHGEPMRYLPERDTRNR